MKKLTLLLIALVCINYTNRKLENYHIANLKHDTIQANTYQVTATMYYPTSSQCDSDPLLTAGMFKINSNKASEHKWIAMSRNMIARWGGEFNYGDSVKIEGAGYKDGIYLVVDTMNKRFKNRIDFLESKGTKKYKFTNVTLTKIEWKTQTQKENLLANL